MEFVSDSNVQHRRTARQEQAAPTSASFRDWRVHVNVPAAFSESLDETDITSGLVNVTWQVSDKNRVTGFYRRQYLQEAEPVPAPDRAVHQRID